MLSFEAIDNFAQMMLFRMNTSENISFGGACFKHASIIFSAQS